MSEEAAASPFDAIRHESDGGEYWSARELSEALSYAKWSNFTFYNLLYRLAFYPGARAAPRPYGIIERI